MTFKLSENILSSLIIASIIAAGADLINTRELLSNHAQRLGILEKNQTGIVLQLKSISTTLTENTYTLKEIQRQTK